jgi:hypothetical protein
MLTVFFGFRNDAVIKPDDFFNVLCEPDWLEDPLVRQMVLDIDKTEIISANLAISPVFGPISPKQLSGGVKALILMYKYPGYICNGYSMGNNCYDWVVKISHVCDCYVTIETTVLIGNRSIDQSPFDAFVENNGHKINTIAEYYAEYYSWMEEECYRRDPTFKEYLEKQMKGNFEDFDI